MRRPTVVGGLLLVALSVAVSFEWRFSGQQQAEIRRWRQRTTELRAEVVRLRQQHAATTNDLLQAEQQLAALPAPAPANVADADRHAQITAWISRVKQLREWFDGRPAQRIPEMDSLKPEDWWRVAQHASFETEEESRAAAAELRNAAKQRFAGTVAAALRKYSKAAGAQSPADAALLAPFLDSPAAAAVLARYEIGHESADSPRTSRWFIQEKTPVDAEYDNRYQFYANGGTSSVGPPLAWIPDFHDRAQAAYRAYTEANRGRNPTKLADVLPFFSPPLDGATIEKVLKQERQGPR